MSLRKNQHLLSSFRLLILDDGPNLINRYIAKSFLQNLAHFLPAEINPEHPCAKIPSDQTRSGNNFFGFLISHFICDFVSKSSHPTISSPAATATALCFGHFHQQRICLVSPFTLRKPWFNIILD